MKKRIRKKIIRRGTTEIKLYFHPVSEKPKKSGFYLYMTEDSGWIRTTMYNKKLDIWNAVDFLVFITEERAKEAAIEIDFWAELPESMRKLGKGDTK